MQRRGKTVNTWLGPYSSNIQFKAAQQFITSQNIPGLQNLLMWVIILSSHFIKMHVMIIIKINISLSDSQPEVTLI